MDLGQEVEKKGGRRWNTGERLCAPLRRRRENQGSRWAGQDRRDNGIEDEQVLIVGQIWSVPTRVSRRRTSNTEGKLGLVDRFFGIFRDSPDKGWARNFERSALLLATVVHKRSHCRHKTLGNKHGLELQRARYLQHRRQANIPAALDARDGALRLSQAYSELGLVSPSSSRALRI